jgi:dinuclear metal center YbgI/SA1388 family protein
MKNKDIKSRLIELFGTQILEKHPDEWGITLASELQDIRRVGWAVSLTPDIAQQAVDLNIDFLITHHDVWSFMSHMVNESKNLLSQAGISHLYVHGPLDEVEFGTAGTILERLGIHDSEPFDQEDGLFWGRSGSLSSAVNFQELIENLNQVFDEVPRFINEGNMLVKKIAIVTGGGCKITCLDEAKIKGCDTYITGEYNCYFGMYAEYAKLNVLVYSHTYTERPGVLRLTEKLLLPSQGIEIVELRERHF